MQLQEATVSRTPVRADVLREIDFLQKELRRRSAPSPDDLDKNIPFKALPLKSHFRYKGLHGGRGSAKSHTFARMLLARCRRNPGTRWVCAREIQLSLAQSVKRLLEDTIKLYQLGDEFQVQNTLIKTPGDGVIIFQGLQDHTATSIKSLEGFHGAWVEEAQSLSATSLELLRPTIREDESELWFSWNPDRASDPVDALLRGAMPPDDACVTELNWQDNPHFPSVLRKEMESDYARDPETAAHVWGGRYKTKSKANVFKNYHIGAFDTPDDAMFLFGGDWGFSVDPTVLLRMFVAEGALRRALVAQYGLKGDHAVLCIDREAYAVGCEIDDTPALFDALDPADPAMARRWPITADSARPETISYMQRHSYPLIQPARKGPGSVEEGIKFLQAYDIIIHTRCPHAAIEFGDYRYKLHPLTGEVTPVLEDKKNHTIDSARYAVEDVDRDGGVTW